LVAIWSPIKEPARVLSGSIPVGQVKQELAQDLGRSAQAAGSVRADVVEHLTTALGLRVEVLMRDRLDVAQPSSARPRFEHVDRRGGASQAARSRRYGMSVASMVAAWLCRRVRQATSSARWEAGRIRLERKVWRVAEAPTT
jgi:hypothetical protein